MILAPRLRLLATNPAVLMVALAVVLYPFVREEKPSRVLRLSVEQVDRALHDERGRSDAPETAERRNSTLERALDEEALAEHALLRELQPRFQPGEGRRLEPAGRRRRAADDALVAHLSNATTPQAIKFKNWAQRNIAYPANKTRERLGIKLAAPTSDPDD